MRLPRFLFAVLAVLPITFGAGIVAAQTPTAPAPPSGSASVGDLLVAPLRVVVSGNRRSAEIALVNTGSEAATYRISLMNLRMRPDGSAETVESPQPSDMSADPLLRFSPRQVTLEPRVAQTVRIQVRKPADLKPGEYRSHIVFRAVPKTDDASLASRSDQGLTVKLIPVYGVSIPIIVRHGETSVKAGLAALNILRDAAGRSVAVRGQITREGNRSVYGDLRVALVPAKGREQLVGSAEGVAVYVPLPARSIEVPIELPKNAALAGARLRVTFLNGEVQGAAGEQLAEAYVSLP